MNGHEHSTYGRPTELIKVVLFDLSSKRLMIPHFGLVIHTLSGVLGLRMKIARQMSTELTRFEGHDTFDKCQE